MSWETIIVAVITSLSTSIVALVPVYLKMRADKREDAEKRKADSREERDSARQASDELVRRLQERIDNLEHDRDELETRLDTEREKRREVETRLAEALIEMKKLESKVAELEKKA